MTVHEVNVTTKHIQIMRSKKVTKPCEECEYWATLKGYLTKHKKTVHEVNVKTKNIQIMITKKVTKGILANNVNTGRL